MLEVEVVENIIDIEVVEISQQNDVEVVENSISINVNVSTVEENINIEIFQFTNGLSAYEIALRNGFFGTEQEWIQDIKGLKGDKGDVGEKGEKGDIGEKGSFAVISGSVNFDFGTRQSDTVVATIINSEITNENFKSFSYIPRNFGTTFIDDFHLNRLTFNIENIIDNTSLDIRALAHNLAIGIFSIDYKITY